MLSPAKRVLLYRAFKPSHVPGLVLDCDAINISGAADSAVATFPDRSGWVNHPVQGTGASQPLLKEGIVAGKPVLRVDGIDDFMTTPLTHSWSTAGWSLFVVARAGSPAAAFRGLVGNRFGAGAANWWTLGINNNVPGTVVLETPGGVQSSFGFDAYGQGFQIYEVITTSPSSISLYRNGALALTAAPGGSIGDVTNEVYIGRWYEAAQIWADDIAAIVMYTRVPSVRERIRVERYLGNRYGVAIS